ncbi:MAG TPA: response regulator [Streptosporangiaceae bacterium]|nr:response regulator [Streptosporangiaceae bacterium]
MTDGTRGPGARILLVEDDEMNRALVRTIVSRCADPDLRAARLVEAGDLAQARAALAGSPFDVVLLDMNLPDGSGLELAAELSESRGGRPPAAVDDDPLTVADGGQPAVVAVTGDSAAGQAGTAITAVCAAVLAKPYTAAQLCGVVAGLLHGDRPAQDAGLHFAGSRCGWRAPARVQQAADTAARFPACKAPRQP